MGAYLAETLTSGGSPSLRGPIPSTRYWAGRHHPDLIVKIAQALVLAAGDKPFSATQLDPILQDLGLATPSSAVSKGKRWAYLRVQRDVGLVVQRARDKYHLTPHAFCLQAKARTPNQCLSTALIREFELANPVHALLSFFVDIWPHTTHDFVNRGNMVRFRRVSDTAIWVVGPKELTIQGVGRNEFNQVWNGILPFLEQIKLLGRFDPEAAQSSERVNAPVWDWNLESASLGTLLPDLQQHIRETYPVGSMIGLPDLVRSFWKVRKVSPKLTLELLYVWAQQPGSEIYLVRAPLAVAEEMPHSYLITATATFGAFVRRQP